jgi:hypothetical protein
MMSFLISVAFFGLGLLFLPIYLVSCVVAWAYWEVVMPLRPDAYDFTQPQIFLAILSSFLLLKILVGAFKGHTGTLFDFFSSD